MIVDDNKSWREDFSREFEFKVAKGAVLKIDTQEIIKSIPRTLIGSPKSIISLSDSLIYYSPQKDFTGKDECFFSSNEEGKNIVTKIIVESS